MRLKSLSNGALRVEVDRTRSCAGVKEAVWCHWLIATTLLTWVISPQMRSGTPLTRAWRVAASSVTRCEKAHLPHVSRHVVLRLYHVKSCPLHQDRGLRGAAYLGSGPDLAVLLSWLYGRKRDSSCSVGSSSYVCSEEMDLNVHVRESL